MKTTDACPISGTPDTRVPSNGDYFEFDCPVCGHYRISGTAMELAGDDDQPVLFDALQAAKRSVEPDQIPMIANLSG